MAGLYITMRLERDREQFLRDLGLPPEDWSDIGHRPEHKIQHRIKTGDISWDQIDAFMS
jgi:hypothetical protein